MDPGVKNQRWKIKSLQEDIKSNPLHIPFFILTETHLKSYHLDAEIQISDYTAIRADRTLRTRGGAAIYLHNSITADTSEVFSNSYCEIAMIYNAHHNMVIAACYRPPLTPFDKFDECLVKLQDFINNIGCTPELYIAGDFNLPFVDWSTTEIKTGSSILLSDRQSGQALIEFMEENFLQQLVNEPTRQDRNILDIILSNNIDMIHSINVSKVEKSDHDLITCTLLHPEFLPVPTEKPPYIPESPLDDINFSSADWSSINKSLEEVNWSTITDPGLSQEEAWNLFSNTIADICKKFAPSHSQGIKTTEATPSNIPKSRRVLLRRKTRLNARINCIKYGVYSTTINNGKLEKLNTQRAEIEILLKADIKKQRLNEELAAIAKIKINPKAFYSFAKRSQSYKSSVGPLKDNKDQLQSDPVKMGSILQHQYAKVFSNPDKANPAEVRVSPQDRLLKLVLQQLRSRLAARSAAERASEVRASAPIKLRQGSGGAGPRKFSWFIGPL